MKFLKQTLIVAVPLALSLSLAGCGGGGGGGGSTTPNVPPALIGAEPNGGSWNPIVLSSGTEVAPPAAAAVTQAERDELRTLQATRNAGATQTARFWNDGVTVRWNEIARELVMKYRVSPPVASRQYAALSVAQYDALVAAFAAKYRVKRPAPAAQDATLTPLFGAEVDPVYPSTHAVVSGASARVLAKFYPAEATFVADKAREAEESRVYAGMNYRSDITAGDALGRTVADRVLTRVAADGANAQLTPRSQANWWINKTRADAKRISPRDTADPGRWTGVNPLLPRWGEVKTWLVPSVIALRPVAPPAFGSAEFNTALAEVRQISDNRTAEQLRIAQFWADGAGTATPPGHWNQIACDLLREKGVKELRSARALALLNMSQMDAAICCWDAKYAYWLLRPWMADPQITTPVGQPNFPSYTSGHSTFSGAAADVLGYIFPDKKPMLSAMADEAALSRLYGGIHYRFDNDRGVEGGRAIAQFAITRGQSDGS
ncbi:MAG TPA: phosphatase PAP2 family protein [Abditibacteriaceae bacterium]|jgi:membrane-associated phospholipid phosphatase